MDDLFKREFAIRPNNDEALNSDTNDLVGSKKDPSKYRGLSIGSTICKLVVNIILSRLLIGTNVS